MHMRVDDAKIADLCQRHGIRKLSFFGSVLTDRFGPHSDVDVLIEFHEGRTPGFFGFGRIEEELTTLLGRKVDLVTTAALSRYMRDEVLASAETHYAES